MKVEVVVAAIAGVVALASAGVTFYGQVWQFESQQRARRRDEVTVLVSRYAEPLVAAAFDLQSRLYNVVRGSFFDAYHRRGTDAERRYAEMSTLWILGQFLGWTEILRREIQFLDLGTVRRNQQLRILLVEIVKVLATDREVRDPRFRIFRADQRAIGEIMITERRGSGAALRSDCLGYGEFTKRMESDDFSRWFTGWAADIQAIAERPAAGPLPGIERLVRLQRALVDLIELLDHDRTRFPLNERGYLPMSMVGEHFADTVEAPGRPDTVPAGTSLARWHLGDDPWPIVESWAESERYASTGDTPGAQREFLRHNGYWGSMSHVVVRYDDDVAEVHAWVVPPVWARFLRVAPRIVGLGEERAWVRLYGRSALPPTNRLLSALGRPAIR